MPLSGSRRCAISAPTPSCGKFQEAKDGFAALGNFSDAAQRAADVDLEIAYVSAGNMVKEGLYADAATAYDKLGDYRDSRELACSARYQLGQQEFQAGNYDEAEALFQALGEYQDAPQQLAQVIEVRNALHYSRAEALAEAGSYEEAIAAGYSPCSSCIK